MVVAKSGTSDNLLFHFGHLRAELLGHVFGAVSRARLPGFPHVNEIRILISV